MKRRKEIADIEQYFQITNNIAPIINEEKVHQIINQPKAKAKLMGKSNNLLKFAIMTTTIVALIIGAFLMLPGSEDEQIPRLTESSGLANSKNQNPNLVESHEQKVVQVENEKPIESDKEEKSNEQQINESSKHEFEVNVERKKNLKEPIITKATIEEHNETILISKKEIDYDTVKVIKGNNLVIRLSSEEFQKIGIFITDSSVIYRNRTGDYCYQYGTIMRKQFINDTCFIHRLDENGRKYRYVIEKIRFGNIWKRKGLTNFDFYPVCKTNSYFDMPIGCAGYSDFRHANDTLVPILFPQINNNFLKTQPEILWFTLTHELYEILKKNHKNIIDEISRIRDAKRNLPWKDFIIYKSPFHIDNLTAINLTESELEKIGFRNCDESIHFTGFYQNYKLEFSNNDIVPKLETNNTKDTEHKDIMPFSTTNLNGSYNSILKDIFDHHKVFTNIDSLIPQCIPVIIPKFSVHKQNTIFWFLPTDDFFNALPQEISQQLQAEYNYITAEDKSTLEKPECKYFEECKNTLKVKDFKVFPNPAYQQATVTFYLPEEIEGKISLVDLTGRERVVLQPQSYLMAGDHRFDLDLSNVNEGIYLITLYSDSGTQTKRLIINK